VLRLQVCSNCSSPEGVWPLWHSVARPGCQYGSPPSAAQLPWLQDGPLGLKAGALARVRASKDWPSQAAHARQPCPEGRAPRAGEPLGAALARLGEALARVHAFYDAIGGLPGYQRRCLQMIADGRGAAAGTGAPGPPGAGCAGEGAGRAGEGADGDAALRFHRPRGLDLAGADGRALAAAAAAAGLAALPHMAEIYPLGGAHRALSERLGAAPGREAHAVC